MKQNWEPKGECLWMKCTFTLTTDVGGGQRICWMHAMAAGAPVDFLGLTRRKEVATVPQDAQ